MPGSELGPKWSRDRAVSQGDQVGIKVHIRTEEVQSKLLVYILEVHGGVQSNRNNGLYIKLCIYRC